MPSIKLNIGGIHFEVSTSLLDDYPNSRLCHIIKNTLSSDEPLFIDRDPKVFKYMLRCIRYGTNVMIPDELQSIVKTDLDYFGFPDLEKNCKTFNV